MPNENELNEIDEQALDDLDSILAMVDDIGDLDDTDSMGEEADFEMSDGFDMEQLLGGYDDASVGEDGEEVFSLDELLQKEEEEEQQGTFEPVVIEEEEVLDIGEIQNLQDVQGLSEPIEVIEEIATGEAVAGSAVNRNEGKADKGPGIFQRLFGNVRDKKTARKAAEEAAKEAARYDEDGVLKKKKEKAKKREEAKEVRAEKKAEKKEADKVKQQEKHKIKEAKKKEKIEKRKAREAEETADPGRINRVGASIVFGFFALFTLVIILGTDSFSYNSSISKAQEQFSKKEYTEAYNSMSGVKLEDADMELYDKVMTVMFVNKQLESYHNYYDMTMYPESLDSLLKGLERYDEYITTAVELGIAEDLNSVKEQMVKELTEVFHMSEQDAYAIIESETQEVYSRKVIAAADILSETK